MEIIIFQSKEIELLTRKKELDDIKSNKLKQPNDLESIKSLLDQVIIILKHIYIYRQLLNIIYLIVEFVKTNNLNISFEIYPHYILLNSEYVNIYIVIYMFINLY